MSCLPKTAGRSKPELASHYHSVIAISVENHVWLDQHGAVKMTVTLWLCTLFSTAGKRVIGEDAYRCADRHRCTLSLPPMERLCPESRTTEHKLPPVRCHSERRSALRGDPENALLNRFVSGLATRREDDAPVGIVIGSGHIPVCWYKRPSVYCRSWSRRDDLESVEDNAYL